MLFSAAMFFMAAFLLLPIMVGLIYHESDIIYFALVSLGTLFAGLALEQAKPGEKKLRAKEGLAISALSWLILSLIGALPFF